MYSDDATLLLRCCAGLRWQPLCKAAPHLRAARALTEVSGAIRILVLPTPALHARKKVMRAISFALLLALAGCGSWTKPGATQAQVDTDANACAVQAAEANPPQIVSAPVIPVADNPECARTYGQAQCSPWAAGPRGSQTDMNDGARHVAYQQCMTAKGYRYSR